MKTDQNPATAHHTITTARRPDNIRSSILVRGRSILSMARSGRQPRRPLPRKDSHFRHFGGIFNCPQDLCLGAVYTHELHFFVRRIFCCITPAPFFVRSVFYSRAILRSSRSLFVRLSSCILFARLALCVAFFFYSRAILKSSRSLFVRHSLCAAFCFFGFAQWDISTVVLYISLPL